MKASSTLPATALPTDAPMGVAWAPIAAFCFLWSSAFAAAKIAVRDCPPLTLLTIRFLIAGALMLGVAAASGRWARPAGRDLAAFAHEQRAFEGLLEFADLLAHGGLAAVHAFTGAGEAARVDDGDKAVQ